MSNLLSSSHIAIWIIAATSVACVILRPFEWPEAIWAFSGAAILVVFRLMPIESAAHAVMKGTDVYLFLVGMMLLAEIARREGLFDWLAAYAVGRAGGSANRLFLLVYGVGTIVTVFLSNDAAAVVLTPAVYAATRTAGAKPLPYLLICAFIANAASFVLPISNPANLVVFGQHMPSLMHWLAQFLLPSVISILITLLVLWWTQRRALGEPIKNTQELPQLSSTAKVSAGGICLTAVALLIASGLDVQLGAPTFVCGLLTVVAVLVIKRESPGSVAKEISWQVLPLVAGLFILVEALQSTGLFHPLTDLIQSFANRTETLASFVSGSVIALLCNAVNNLPLGLVAGTIVSTAHLPSATTSSILIGVDLGPNLSITGSLATILWILALRREGEKVTAWQFMKVGLLVMPSALFGALATCIASSALTQ